MNKRDFIRNGLLAGAGLLAGFRSWATPARVTDASGLAQAAGPFTLPALPYAPGALAPHIDEETMQIHHGKHHQAYVDKLNAAVANTPAANLKLEDILANIGKYSPAVRNNGGGHWNHSFFWTLLSPSATQPSQRVMAAINRDFGSMDKFKEQFGKAAADRFGSGWAWLIVKDKKLVITSTPNQDNPLMNLDGVERGTPILGLDVWEHAYYLKYRNKRTDYITAFWNVVNWNRVDDLFAKA